TGNSGSRPAAAGRRQRRRAGASAGGVAAAVPRGRGTERASRLRAPRHTASIWGLGLMGRWRIVNGLLVVIVALLGFEIARTWARALPAVQVPTTARGVVDPESQPVHEKGRRGAEKAAARAQQAPAVLVAAITEKDLFDQSRHPPTPDEVKV